MAWPSDVATGNIIFAADVNAAYLAARAWGGNVDAGGHDLQNLGNLYAPGQTRCHIYNSQSQSIPNAAWTNVLFDSEISDVGGMFDVGNPSRITLPVTGVYLIVADFIFAANATGLRQISINLNGSIRTHITIVPGVGSADHRLQTIALYARNGGEWIEVQALQTSGGPLNIGGASAVVQRLS